MTPVRHRDRAKVAEVVWCRRHRPRPGGHRTASRSQAAAAGGGRSCSTTACRTGERVVGGRDLQRFSTSWRSWAAVGGRRQAVEVRVTGGRRRRGAAASSPRHRGHRGRVVEDGAGAVRRCSEGRVEPRRGCMITPPSESGVRPVPGRGRGRRRRSRSVCSSRWIAGRAGPARRRHSWRPSPRRLKVAAPSARNPYVSGSERQSVVPFLRALGEVGGSDLHCKVGSPPRVRIDGTPAQAPGARPDARGHRAHGRARCCATTWSRSSRRTNEADFAYSVPGVGRFRVNAFRSRGSAGMVFRRVSVGAIPLEELGPAAGAHRARHGAPRAGARHRPDRLGQDDDARRDDRPDQQQPRGATSSRSRTRSRSCTSTSSR